MTLDFYSHRGAGFRRRRCATPSRESAARLLQRFRAVRDFSVRLCRGLQPEDYVVQSMPDVSPTKWHLAHTTWFFETFVVKVWVQRYRSEVPQYAYPLQFLLQRRRRHASARSARPHFAADGSGNVSLP